MKIVFMGTPHFAVPSLEKLIEQGYYVAAVVTQPDRKSGRGHKMMPPPVKTAAMAHDIPMLQFEKIKTDQGVAGAKRNCTGYHRYGRVRADTFKRNPRYSADGLHQRTCVAAAEIQRRCAHTVGGHQRGSTNGRYDHVYGRRAGHRGHDCVRRCTDR